MIQSCPRHGAWRGLIELLAYRWATQGRQEAKAAFPSTYALVTRCDNCAELCEQLRRKVELTGTTHESPQPELTQP